MDMQEARPWVFDPSPGYFDGRPIPVEPQHLVEHRALNLRLPSRAKLSGWRVLQNGQEARVVVDGPPVFDTIDLILDAALAGLGLAYLPLDQVQPHIDAERLQPVMADSLPPLPGYQRCYLDRRNASPAFRLFVESLRWRPGKARLSPWQQGGHRTGEVNWPPRATQSPLDRSRQIAVAE